MCCICHCQHRLFDPTIHNDLKVADHELRLGYYIWAAHDECNRKRRVLINIPVLFLQIFGLRFTSNRHRAFQPLV